MRIVTPTPLLRDAANALAAVRDDVVVIGAAAVHVALDGHDAVLTPTLDVDAGVRLGAVERVVAHLEAQQLRRSELPHERHFTVGEGRAQGAADPVVRPACEGSRPRPAGQQHPARARSPPCAGRLRRR